MSDRPVLAMLGVLGVEGKFCFIAVALSFEVVVVFVVDGVEVDVEDELDGTGALVVICLAGVVVVVD